MYFLIIYNIYAKIITGITIINYLDESLIKYDSVLRALSDMNTRWNGTLLLTGNSAANRLPRPLQNDPLGLRLETYIECRPLRFSSLQPAFGIPMKKKEKGGQLGADSPLYAVRIILFPKSWSVSL